MHSLRSSRTSPARWSCCLTLLEDLLQCCLNSNEQSWTWHEESFWRQVGVSAMHSKAISRTLRLPRCYLQQQLLFTEQTRLYRRWSRDTSLEEEECESSQSCSRW